MEFGGEGITGEPSGWHNEDGPVPYTTEWEDRRRSVLGPSAAIFHFEVGEDIRAKDLHRLNGLQMNVTGMEDGKALFSSAGDEEHEGIPQVEGRIEGQHVSTSRRQALFQTMLLIGTLSSQAKAHHGLQTRALSFTIPGLDTEVRGNWITVSRSKESRDDESAQAFAELWDGLRKEKPRKQKRPDLMESYMQLRNEALKCQNAPGDGA